ncbi:MAG: hypothetical protein Gaeavirus11_15 [Gaeavirus sp.]|uniref:Leucine-rich repeat protein n=1 Tax=Gaeavirus sp. TaxID=2487767 RepID=A0A3G4ZYY3_9VIRU|nr:MAG: hypothetical protein Gaeavirus11_15 [Gaeavirus sp.]
MLSITSNAELRYLPESDYEKVAAVSITHAPITFIDMHIIKQFINLEFLTLNNVIFESEPDFPILTKLKYLSLNGNHFKYVPTFIHKLTNLVVLSLDFCNVMTDARFTHEIANLQKLIRVSIRGEHLDDIKYYGFYINDRNLLILKNKSLPDGFIVPNYIISINILASFDNQIMHITQNLPPSVEQLSLYCSITSKCNYLDNLPYSLKQLNLYHHDDYNYKKSDISHIRLPYGTSVNQYIFKNQLSISLSVSEYMTSIQ